MGKITYIETEFELGEEVWVLTNKYQSILCFACEGHGELYTRSNKATSCRDCRGEGKVEENISVSEKTKIDAIQVTTRTDSYMAKHTVSSTKLISVMYSLETDIGTPSRTCDLFFRTKDEAEEAAKEK